MSRRKPLAALAAVTAALALAVPAGGASAATTTPSAAHTFPAGFGDGFVSGSLPCQFLVNDLRFAFATGNVPAENFLGEVLLYSGCGGAAI